jgi:hypothetical protein
MSTGNLYLFLATEKLRLWQDMLILFPPSQGGIFCPILLSLTKQTFSMQNRSVRNIIEKHTRRSDITPGGKQPE